MSTYRTEFVVGKVLNQQKHIKTHVYSEGGGGYVGPHGGRVKAPEVKSYNTTRHDIFLEMGTGQEISVSFPFDDIILRDGHIVTMISVFRDAANSGYYVRLINHNTGTIYNVQTKEITDFLTKETNRQARKVLFLGIAVVFPIQWLFNTFFPENKDVIPIALVMMWIIPLVSLIRYIFIHNIPTKKNEAVLKAEVEGTVNRLLAQDHTY